MAEVVEITYHVSEKDLSPPEGFAMFGIYKTRFDDGYTVMTPHTGFIGTVSEWPLDLEDDEQRQIVAQSAKRSRGDV